MIQVLAMSEACPLYSQELEKIQSDKDIVEFYAQFSSVFEYIFNNADPNMEEKLGAIDLTMMLYQALTIEVNILYTYLLY